MALLLGWDGGGTNTRFLVADDRTTGARFDAESNATIPWRVGGSSLSRNSPAAVAAVLAEGVGLVCATLGCQPGDFAAAAGGFASAGSAANRAVYENLWRQLLPCARVRVVTDAELAWHGSAGGGDGIVVIAGTGSIAWGRYLGRDGQAGGEGPGRDPGSADAIARQAVAAGLAPTPADGNYAALVPALLRHSRPRMAPIFQRAGTELAGLAAACAATLAWPEPDIYPWGGVFEYIPEVRLAFRHALRGRLCQPRSSPTEAALELARALLLEA